MTSSEIRDRAIDMTARPLGELLFALGRPLPFIADAFTSVVSLGAVSRIRGQESRIRGQERLPHRRVNVEIGVGLRWVIFDLYSRSAFRLTAGTVLISEALIMVFLIRAHAEHLTPIAIRLVLAASGMGGILGSVVASKLFSRFGYSLLRIQMWVWAGTLAILVVSGGQANLGMAAAMTSFGFSSALGKIELDIYLSRNVPENILTRVVSVALCMSYTGLALGAPLGEIAGEDLGVTNAIFMLFIAASCLLIVALVSMRKVRYLAKG